MTISPFYLGHYDLLIDDFHDNNKREKIIENSNSILCVVCPLNPQLEKYCIDLFDLVTLFFETVRLSGQNKVKCGIIKAQQFVN